MSDWKDIHGVNNDGAPRAFDAGCSPACIVLMETAILSGATSAPKRLIAAASAWTGGSLPFVGWLNCPDFLGGGLF